MKTSIRKVLRNILKYLSLVAIKKHSLEIIAVGGWYGTDIGREAIYTILKHNGKKVRRIIKTPEVDWDIPLSILGIKQLPQNAFIWIYEVLKSIVLLLIVKPNPSMLVLQINTQDAGIMKYWMSFLNPSAVVMLNSHAGTLNLELLLADKVHAGNLLVLNNDNIRTKSLAQGKNEQIVYFGEYKKQQSPDYYYLVNKNAKQELLYLGHGKTNYPIKKIVPEFVYPFFAAAIAITEFYAIPLDAVCDSLNYFELPSDKIQHIFHRFIED